MKKEFDLSDEILPDGFISSVDVKKAVKLLKEEVVGSSAYKEYLIRIIDKIFGDKLNGR